MGFRELTMIEVRELLRRQRAGESARRTARECGADRKTVRRYYEAAERCGVRAGIELTDELVAEVAKLVQARPAPAPSDAWKVLVPVRERIEAWLSAERPLRLVRIHELLAREGVRVSYSTLRRYVQRELGVGGPRVTVRLADTAPGEEAQVDFGHVGWLVDITDKRRKLWALIVTLSFSRHMFVWPTLTQTVADVCEGLDEAWRFFGGIPKRAVLDNASSMVTVPSAQAPVLQRSFQEYAQARGLLVDPARVRHPQDKGRVENAVPYVRERWADGERFLDLGDSRRSAARWCNEVAGARIHGTTRAVPREVFAAEEKAHLAPPPEARFDLPIWSQAKVHPDHHVQVARALYSVPTAYIGRQLDVRLDSKTVRLYSGAELVKVHGRVAPGKRSTDPADYPRTKAAYALRSVDALVHVARGKGEHVGAFAQKLLSGPLPWSKMRQAQALVRLCDRHGAEHVDAACARAIAFEVYDVPRIERMLKLARWSEAGAEAAGKVVRLPGRFARATDHFTTQRPKDGGAP
jgi:transposase